MAAMVPIFVSGMLGGANFHANPFNLVMWMHIGAIYCLLRYDRQRVRETPANPPAPSRVLADCEGGRSFSQNKSPPCWKSSRLHLQSSRCH